MCCIFINSPGPQDQVSQVQELASGSVTSTTSYGYDADGQPSTEDHAGGDTPQYSAYAYNTLNQLQKVSVGSLASDASPKVTTYTYTDRGQQASQTKANGNVVTSTYDLDGSLASRVEKTSGGTLVSEHTYSYDPNGNQTQDVSKEQDASDHASYLSHTTAYTYDPRDRIAQVSRDGTVTETYRHDANDNVTAQTVNGVTTSFDYNRNRLISASAGGSAVSYNYDPFGRRNTVTAGGTVMDRITYDGFDHITAEAKRGPDGTLATTTHTFDALDRTTSTTTGAGTTSAQTTDLNYLGLSSQVLSEGVGGTTTKTYQYAPGGQRLSQDTIGSTGTQTFGYFGYNAHTDVTELTGADGQTTATYGYTAYGQDNPADDTGADANPGTGQQAYNSYRFNGKRYSASTGSYDMGFRTYDPGLNTFTSRDMYNGALADQDMSTDPFTGNRYAFGQGNPITNIELNGHCSYGASDIHDDCQYGTEANSGDGIVAANRSTWVTSNSPTTSNENTLLNKWQTVAEAAGATNYWNPKYGDQTLCFGRLACQKAYQYLDAHPNGITKAKDIAATYCANNFNTCNNAAIVEGGYKTLTMGPSFLGGAGAADAVETSSTVSLKRIITSFKNTLRSTSGRLRVTAGNPSASEPRAAQHMADLGNDVELRDPVGTRSGGRTSDLLVNGEQWDVYTPGAGTSVRNILNNVAKKWTQVNGGGVVVDLANTAFNADDFGDALARANGFIKAWGGVPLSGVELLEGE